jgi:hypothetical protein
MAAVAAPAGMSLTQALLLSLQEKQQHQQRPKQQNSCVLMNC